MINFSGYNSITGSTSAGRKRKHNEIDRLKNSYPVSDVQVNKPAEIRTVTLSREQEFSVDINNLSPAKKFKHEGSQVFEMLNDTFSKVPEATVAEVLALCDGDFVLAAQELSDLHHNG